MITEGQSIALSVSTFRGSLQVQFYYETAFLGGAGDLRGLREERFAGDAMVYAGAELRAFLARLTLALPIDMGVFGLADVGRV